MSQQNLPLPSSAKPLVLTLHGFPQWRGDPSAQFTAIRTTLRLPSGSWRDFFWVGDTTRQQLEEAFDRLKDPMESFSAHYADLFDPWLHDQVKTIGSNDPVVILAYSLGALIFFRWLADKASLADVEGITTIFCLAGPYRFRNPQTVFMGRRVFQILEQTLPARRIGRYLRRWQLVALSAEGEDRFTLWNCLFGPQLTYNIVDQHVIGGADHDTLCTHPATLDYIRVRFPT